MIPLLIELGLALAGGIAQKVSADKQHDKDLDKYGKNFARDIMDKRASRAGDSMYMQNAISHRENAPEAPPSPFPGVVAGMGSALLGYNGGSAGKVAGSALESALGPQGFGNPAVQGDRAGYEATKPGIGADDRGSYDAAKGGNRYSGSTAPSGNSYSGTTAPSGNSYDGSTALWDQDEWAGF